VTAVALRLDRSFWTPLLLVATLLLAIARTWVLHRQGLEVEGELALAAELGAVMGAALFPWALGALVAYAHWFWSQFRRDRAYMTNTYPYRRRKVLHATVLLALLLMVSELIWRLALSAGLA
jgi:hypothetical protein